MNTAYPLLPVTVVSLLAYLTTWGFSAWGIFSRKLHRKIWNYALLVTFLVSGLLGLVSVIKINYKLEIPGYDQLLRWHVSVGIGMVIISLFHLSWHLKYYFSLPAKKNLSDSFVEIISGYPQRKISVLLFLLGMLAIINQLVFIREFISVLAGNELILGVVMANWLLITGWGAYTGRNSTAAALNMKRQTSMLLAVALLPVLLTGLLYWLKSQLFPPGTLTGMSVAIAGVFLLLFPVCFLSGYLFTSFSATYSTGAGKNLIGKAYALESLGSLAGGLLFSVMLGNFFNSIQIFSITGGIVFSIAFFLFRKENKKHAWLYIAAGFLIPIVIFIFNPDTQIKKLLYPNQKIVFNRSTRYGNLVVTKQADQLNFYENNDLQFYTDDIMINEEAVHFAMLQHDHPKNILLISGGIAGMIKEIDKYKVNKITYLETNPEILDRWKNLAGYNENQGHVDYVKKDIRTFLKSTSQIYDVILINLPPPATLGFNRFYTEEFFKLLAKHCNNQTVVSTSLPSTFNYAEANALNVNASLWKTLSNCFRNRELIPGEKNYFLASNSPLSLHIATLDTQRGIENSYVNSYYFDDTLLAQRSKSLVAKFDLKANVNRDFHPRMFISQTCHWLSHFGVSLYLLIIIPAILSLLLLFSLKPVSMGLCAGGFTSAALEISLMLAYQVFFGSIYIASALFFAIFMGGLAAGSHLNKRASYFSTTKRFASLQLILAFLALAIPVFVFLIDKISGMGIIARFLFFLLIFILAFIIGIEYNAASQLRNDRYSTTTGINYSADLAGSAFGAYLSSLFLIPVLGLTITCMVISFLNLLTGTIIFYSGKTE